MTKRTYDEDEDDDPGIGHNSISAGDLRQFVSRIERLEEEKAALLSDIKEIYAEAKSSGFDVKILRSVVALRKKDPEKLHEEDAVRELYMEALGML